MKRHPNGTGPAILSSGFRPFFLFGSLYAAGIVAVWVPWFLGFVSLPTAFPPAAWHAHDLLFGGFLPVIAGYLLTALSARAGRPPLAGGRLGALFAVWLAGRLAVAGSPVLGPLATSLATLIFPMAVAAVLARTGIGRRNMQNLQILALVCALIVAQALFHWEIWRFGRSAHGERLAVSATLLLIMVIGGRIVPSLREGAPGMVRFDTAVMGLSVAALAAWIAHDTGTADALVGILLMTAGCAQAVRVARRTVHLALFAHLFIPMGFLLAGYAVLRGSTAYEAAAIHAWTVGTVATTSLAVMMRAGLDHTGRTLAASWVPAAIQVALIIAAGARIAVALEPRWTMILMPLAGGAWVLGFLGFALAYGPMLLTPTAQSAEVTH